MQFSKQRAATCVIKFLYQIFSWQNIFLTVTRILLQQLLNFFRRKKKPQLCLWDKSITLELESACRGWWGAEGEGGGGIRESRCMLVNTSAIISVPYLPWLHQVLLQLMAGEHKGASVCLKSRKRKPPTSWTQHTRERAAATRTPSVGQESELRELIGARETLP